MVLYKITGRCLLFIVITLFTAPANGMDACTEPNNPNELIQCALQRHPDIQKQDLKINRDASLEKLAGQRPNPDFSYETTFGEPEADTRIEGEIFVGFPFELGGKRKARIQKALAQKGVSDSELRQLQENIVIKMVLSLYRLKQISSEIELISEALATFRQIERQYKVRKILTPHQEVSLNIFQLASQDYEIRKASILREQTALAHSIKKVTSLPTSRIMKCLPKAPASWPKLNNKDLLKSAIVAKAEKDHRVALTEQTLANSEAWPNLNVGPLVKYESSQDLGFGYGFGVALPLPLLNRNKGGKEVAAKEVMLAERNLMLQKQESQWDYDEFLKIYTLTVNQLKNSSNLHELENRHHRLHQHFFSGIVETSLVVETHRQLVDLTRDRNQLELEALSALWSIYALEGSIMEERL